VVATTNCVLIPPESYKGRLFTTRGTAVPGGQCISDGDYSEVLAEALRCEPCEAQITGESTVGFHRTVLLDHAQTIVDAVKAGQISRFFVIGGCDGADPGRNYFSDYAQGTPDDSFILTLVISWFEQKAVAVLLTLLSLGVKGITLGPNAPAFVSPNVFAILQERFDLRLSGNDAEGDLRLAMTA
jgi:hydroxylamine reductase